MQITEAKNMYQEIFIPIKPNAKDTKSIKDKQMALRRIFVSKVRVVFATFSAIEAQNA